MKLPLLKMSLRNSIGKMILLYLYSLFKYVCGNINYQIEPLLLSRMIRQSEGPAVSEVKDPVEKTHTHKDGALWAPTGWVHVEKDIDFSDPKVI